MKGNTTVVIELPISLDEMIAQLQLVTTQTTNNKIWNASFRESSQRDGTPKQLSLTIGWFGTEA